MNDVSDATTTGNGRSFDPAQAAALLNQTTQQARRTFAPGSPLLWSFRAVLVLVAFGSFWLSVRSQQDPYSGPKGWSLAVTFVLVAINIGWSAWANIRAGIGVSGPAQQARRIWIGMMLVVFFLAYAVTSPLYHGGPGHPVWGLYPASAPLMTVAVVAAATAAIRKDWTMTVITLVIGLVTVIAGFGGPVGAWLIMAIGMCVLCLSVAVYKAWQQHRSVVQS
jgi:hypothetical protein